MRVRAFRLLIFVSLGACARDDGRSECGPDEVRIATRCVFVGDAGRDVASPDAPDATDVSDAADIEDADGTETTADVDDATTAETVDISETKDGEAEVSGTGLPFFVDEHYVMSGYMGSGEVDVADCGASTPADSLAGACWKITWKPATGTTADWTGFYFQYPENNWGDAPGYPVPAGAAKVTLRAWGRDGGESANFAVGIQAADGFQKESGYRQLTKTPADQEVSLAGVTYTDVAGGFAWFLENRGAKSEVVFFLDDIRWVAGTSSGTPGCTDSDASNYAPGATVDDGSCTYAVTFEVDMRCPDPDTAFATVWLTGPFCTWCGDGFQLLDPDGDKVYVGTWPFPIGPLEHKFMTNGFASQEDLIDDAQGGGTCAPVTDSSTYANRRLQIVDAPITDRVVYGRCGGCP